MVEYFLAIDWGKSFIGLAIAEKELGIASGLGQVKNKEIFVELEKIKKEFPFQKIVLGVIESQIFKDNQKAILSFKAELEKLGFEVILVNENFSTKLAGSNLKELKNAQNKSRAKNKKMPDNAESARIILQGWIDGLVS